MKTSFASCFQLTCLFVCFFAKAINGLSLLASDSVSKLLQVHADGISTLKSACEAKVGPSGMASQPYCNDVFFLRWCLASPGDTDEQLSNLEKCLEWRNGEGKSICTAATTAIAEAMSSEGGWKNDPVLKAAPYADVISKYIKPSNVITTTSSKDDLVYCIRAGQIDDNSLMNEVSIDQMVEFFLYAKEVNAIVSNIRSTDLDKLVCVITANDLSGVKLAGGSGDFRKALGASSNQANGLYPSTAGPTLLLNLPKLLSALVKLFTPLFSKEVKDRLKFAQGPLKDVSDFQQIASTASGPARTTFIKQLDDIVYSS